MFENQDLELMLDKTNFPFKRLADNMWQVAIPTDDVHNMIVTLQDTLLVIRLKLKEVNAQADANFYKKLLQMNATDITHGAFAVENNSLILIDSLETENLDLNELAASIQAIAFTARNCYKELK